MSKLFLISYVGVYVAVALNVLSLFVLKLMFKYYSLKKCSFNMTGEEFGNKILAKSGVKGVKVIETDNGDLTDYYDPLPKVVALSIRSFRMNSIAAIGITAHECGHAIQHSKLIKCYVTRLRLAGVANFSSSVSVPLVMIGAFLDIFALRLVGLVLFGITTLFYFFTLVVEIDASNRALKIIRSFNANPKEVRKIRRMLIVAAMTYVSTFLFSLFEFIKYFALSEEVKQEG